MLVREECGVDKRSVGEIFKERNSEMRQCVHWEMGAYWGERSGVLQLSGITLGARRVHRARWESGAMALSSARKELQRRAEAVLMEVGEETSLRAAIRLLGGRRTVSGGRHDSAARIGRAVDRKQLVTHLFTWRHWTSILSRRPLVGVNRSAP